MRAAWSGSLQQHAHLRALEERHRVARVRRRARGRARRAPRRSAARRGRGRPARGRARSALPCGRARLSNDVDGERRLPAPIASSPEPHELRRRGRAHARRSCCRSASASVDPSLPLAHAAPAPRAPGRRSGDSATTCSSSGTARCPVLAARVVQREVGADVLRAGRDRRRPCRTPRAPAPRARARSARSRGAARRRGCPGSAARIFSRSGMARAYSSRDEEAGRLLERRRRAGVMSAGPRRVLAHDGRAPALT